MYENRSIQIVEKQELTAADDRDWANISISQQPTQRMRHSISVQQDFTPSAELTRAIIRHCGTPFASKHVEESEIPFFQQLHSSSIHLALDVVILSESDHCGPTLPISDQSGFVPEVRQQLAKGLAGSRGYAPVHTSNIIAWLVNAHFAEIDSPATKGRGISTGKRRRGFAFGFSKKRRGERPHGDQFPHAGGYSVSLFLAGIGGHGKHNAMAQESVRSFP